jgi:hypothetical protein
MHPPRLRAVLPWVGLACILCAFLVVVVRLHPTNFFGMSQDDTFYFSSAKAIAQGRGYIMPSLPGAPAATKYPQLYPWLLSFVWRWNPSFPNNLVAAIGLSVFCGVAFLSLTFLFLKHAFAMNDWEALAITAFCALQPYALFYGGSVLTEIPFAALVLATLVLAERGTWPDSRPGWALLCGVLAGLSAETRIFGFALVAGIAIAGLLRRARRQVAVFCTSAGVLLVPVVWRQLFLRPATPAPIAQHAGLGWTWVWIYDTSYLGFWRTAVPNVHVFLAMLLNNFEILTHTPSYYLLAGSLLARGRAAASVPPVVTAIIVIGLVRQVRRSGWTPIHCVLPLYAAIAMLWNFNDFFRFFLPFMPVFVAAYWRETRHLAAMIGRVLVDRGKVTDLVAGVVLAAAILTANALIAWTYFDGQGPSHLKTVSESRAKLLASERQAYRWISRSTAPSTRIIAYQDAEVYLYTGRQCMRPIAFTTAEFLQPKRLPGDLEHITDVARAISAEYWLVSDDDFSSEFSAGREAAERRMREIERVLPVVFRSSDGRVRIYGLGCVANPNEHACATADKVLFPDGERTVTGY